MPDFTGVEIARTGTYNLSTGEHTFTRDQLAAAVRNAEAGVAPRLGPGHIDPRFNGPEHDGSPALGKVVNLRLAEDGDVLLGDYADMPAWLENSLETAYPGRSLEASVSGDDLRITRVKLLGLTLPGISNLKDLQRHLSDEGPLQIAAGEDGNGKRIEVVVAATEDAAAKLGAYVSTPRRTIAASIDLDQLRSAYEEGQRSSGPLSPWVQDVRLDPNELIVRDGTRFFRVPWSWDEDAQQFRFEPAVEVRVDYVELAATTKPDERRHDNKEGHMTPKEIRAALGLPEDATDEQVKTSITASAAAVETTKLVRSNLGLPEDATDEQVKAKLDERPIAAAGQIVVDKAQFDEIKAAADLGRTAHQTLVQRDDAADRDTYLDSKVLDGTLHPDSVESYHELWAAAGAEKAKKAIDAMPSGLVPVLERGERITASATTDLPADGSVPDGLSVLTPAERKLVANR